MGTEEGPTGARIRACRANNGTANRYNKGAKYFLFVKSIAHKYGNMCGSAY